MRTIITTILIIGVFTLGAYLLWPKQENVVVTDFKSCVAAGNPVLESFPEQCRTPDGSTFINPENVAPVEETNGPLRNLNVTPNQVIESSFVVRGDARGFYFEGSFPVTLLDANGKTLVQTYATAQGDWMTSDFVPFVSEKLNFSTSSKTGTLVLQNDNASGIPQNDKIVRIPVRFQQETRNIKIYYYNASKDEDAGGNILCSTKGLVAVNRTVPLTVTPIQDAIKELLKGEISSQEKSSGLASNFPLAGVDLNAASLDKGVLTLTFTDPQHSTSGGACRINVLRAQIEATAKQFPEVKSVRIMPATLFQP